MRAPDRYLDLLKRCLTRELFLDEEVRDVWWWPETVPLGDPDELHAKLAETPGWRIVRHNRQPEDRHLGRDQPPTAETMIGSVRLDNVHELAVRAIEEGIEGDFVETGVWRGGTIILLRAVLAAYDDTSRTVWACDSFQGLPEPDLERYPMDETFYIERAKGTAFIKDLLAVSADTVRQNLARYDLLDERVQILEGWFKDTLTDPPMDRIALLRLDGDLYQSTMDALVGLEERVSPGGFIIVDDYNSFDACRQAVTDFRQERGIDAEIHEIDWTGVWWQKEPAREVSRPQAG